MAVVRTVTTYQSHDGQMGVLSFTLTQTGKFLGFDVPKGRVWLLSELSPRTIRGQMGVLSFTPDEGIRCCYLSEQRLAHMTPDGVLADLDREFNLAIQHNEVPSLVVWDTMGRWLTGHGKDFNAYGDMASATLPLLKLIVDMGQLDTSTIVAHHGNKSGRGGAESSLGSQALAGSFDNVVNLRLVTKAKGGANLNGPRYITVQGRNDTNETFRNGAIVQLHLPEGDLCLVDNVDAVDMEEMDTLVQDAVFAGADTRAKVEEAIGEDRKTVLASLVRLLDNKAIIRIGKGLGIRYFPPGMIGRFDLTPKLVSLASRVRLLFQ